MNTNIVGNTLGTFGQKRIDLLARVSIEKGVSATFLKGVSVIVYLLAGVLLGMRAFMPNPINWIHILAGVIILLAGLVEMVEDAILRMSGDIAKFGIFSNAVLDRYTDMAIFTGAIAYFAFHKNILFVVISLLAFIGAIMTSYTRAMAESLFPGKYNSGYMERPERIVMLIVTCMLNRLYVGMLFIAIFANLATLHRIWDTRQTAFNLEHPQRAGKGYGSPHSPAIIRFMRSIVFWKYPRQTWQHDAMSAVLLLLILLSLFLS